MKKIGILTLFCFVVLSLFPQTSDTIRTGRISPNPDSSRVYTFVEQNPEFPGGDAVLMKFIANNFRYPELERKKGIEGKVILRFVIEEDGSVSHVQVTKSVSPGLDAEAVRVAELLPKFIPGRQQGKPVRTYFNLPVSFKLQ